MLGRLLFFTQSVRSITAHFDRLFKEADEEDENKEKTNQGSGSPIEQYGIIPFILKVIEITNETWGSIMGWSICQVFYLTCYAIDKQKLDELVVNNWRKTH